MSVFALVGSYKNESYLTKIYLLDFHLTHLKLSEIIDVSKFNKRDNVDRMLDVSDVENVDAVENRDLSSTLDGVQSAIDGIIDSLTYKDLGLAEVYSISLWGYCKGEVSGEAKTKNGFDNSKINFKWCSKPKPAYFFDPLTILKHELNNTINDRITGPGEGSLVETAVKKQLQVLLDNVSYESLNLPGSLYKDLKLLNRLTTAAFVLILICAVLAVIAVVIQLLGCCVSPENCCLSFLNFFFQTIVFLTGVIGAGIATGAYMFVRQEINKKTSDVGVKSYLSIAFYALIWSAVVAAFLVLVFCLLGHCCGCCFGKKKKYEPVGPPVPEKDDMGYDHKENF